MLSGFYRFGYRAFFTIAVMALGLFVDVRPTLAAGNVTGWMWSATAGWISASCENFGTCATSDYGLEFVDVEGALAPRRAKLSGFAWSSAVGWICYGESCGGINPEGSASYAEWRDFIPASGGIACTTSADCADNESCVGFLGNRCSRASQLYGWAKVVSLGDDGWIALNCRNDLVDSCATSNFYVAYERGKLTKTLPPGPDPDNYHWGWGATASGTGLGWVDFSGVVTDWSPPFIGRVRRPEGIYEPDNPTAPGTHPATFEIEVENVSSAANYRLECSILRSNGMRSTAGVNFGGAAKFDETVYLPYTITASDAAGGGIQQNKLWHIDSCRIAGRVNATVCAIDATCGANAICDESVGLCRKLVLTSDQRRPIFVHGNDWTKFGANDDYYQAIKCWTGFPGEFLMNSKHCDFTGDASFSLAMSKGIPIKRDCRARGAVPDCADRFCANISYLCPTTPARRPTTCSRYDPESTIPACNAVGYEVGELCCSNQPYENGASYNHVVDVMECEYGDAGDGYYDCDCATGRFGTGDCFAPGATAGEYCCSSDGDVVKI